MLHRYFTKPTKFQVTDKHTKRTAKKNKTYESHDLDP